MVGDWVMYDPNVFIEDEYEPTHKMYPAKIESGEDIDCAINDCYSPIPLTVEILYKNGFDCDEDGFISYNEFAINFGRDPFEEGPNLLFVWVGNSHVELHYVHELQHALRLCQIEKEIEI